MEESLKLEGLAESIKENFGLDDVDLRTYNPLSLAFIGDSIYETLVRTIVVEK